MERLQRHKHRLARVKLVFTAMLTVASLVAACANAQVKNGFDLSSTSIPVEEILLGGPPRDGIPSIDDPQFVSGDSVNFLRDDDIVVGLVGFGIPRAYPLRILVWHEIANDILDGEPVAVTYCPLCGTAMVFSRVAGGVLRTFGVSGLLYQSDVLMYDRETESLWSQLGMRAVSGTAMGDSLKWVPSVHMTWESWKSSYPDSRVLSTNTGHSRDYGGRPYEGYSASDDTMFPVNHARHELKNKAQVVGVVVAGRAAAYAIDALPDGEIVADTVAGIPVKIIYDRKAHHPHVTTETGEEVPSVVAYWFAWQAFYPETLLWAGDR